MITVLEETATGMQRDGRRLSRRVYLATDGADILPDDAAPGSLALVRNGSDVQIKLLFPDGVWCAV